MNQSMLYNWILIVLSVLFLRFTCKHQQPGEGQGPAAFKQVDIGFNLGYLGETKMTYPVLDSMKRQGFDWVRVYEPFTRGLYRDTAKILDLIGQLVKRDCKVLLSLSNFPYEADEHRLPASREKVKQIYRYSNRFPPLDLEKYLVYVKAFMDALQQRGYLEHLSIEIFNEPDAANYFWGNAKEFSKIRDRLYRLLEPYPVELLCCGFTTGPFLDDKPRKQAFLETIHRDTMLGTGADLSFHYYMNSSKVAIPVDQLEDSVFYSGQITEFNVYSTLRNTQEERIQQTHSYRIMDAFVSVLEFAYRYDLERIYIFKLIDNPKKKGVLGFFDVHGAPKYSFELLRALWSVIREGYYVNRTTDYVDIIGQKASVRYALRAVSAQQEKIRKFAGSGAYNGQLKPGEWVIFDH